MADLPFRINSTTDYMTAMRSHNQPEPIDFPDIIPASHSGHVSIQMTHELVQAQPALRAKAAMNATAKQQNHKPDDDMHHVFCYLAPRIKPSKVTAQIILLFALRKSESYAPVLANQCARPFDSGGLKMDAQFKETITDEQLKKIIQNLTFRDDWHGYFKEWIAHMFFTYDAYMMGEPPTGIDPLLLNHTDRWNFTWELLTKDTLPFENRLVAIMEIRSPGSSTTMNAHALRAVRQKEQAGRIKFQVIEQTSALDQVLYSLFQSACTLSGW